MTKKYIGIKDKFTIGPKKKNFEDLTAESKWSRIYYEQNPEKRQQKLKRQAERYVEKRPIIVEQKKQKKREQLIEVVKMLGRKCDACEELFNPNLEISNLEIHHLSYDEKELMKQSRYGSISSTVRDVLKMAKNGMNPRKKYVLLCKQCHNIETFSHQDPKKTFDMYCWLYEQGIFEKVLNDDAKNNRKITEFPKQS